MFFIFLNIELASSKSSLSLIEPSFIFVSILEPILLTRFINLLGFLNNFVNTSLTSATFSISISKSLLVSSANSLANEPIFPLIKLLICEKIVSPSGKLFDLLSELSLSAFDLFIFLNIFSKSNGLLLISLKESKLILDISLFIESNIFSKSIELFVLSEFFVLLLLSEVEFIFLKLNTFSISLTVSCNLFLNSSLLIASNS